jgi:pimeloyl-ACP methyl ester carboxylesterase
MSAVRGDDFKPIGRVQGDSAAAQAALSGSRHNTPRPGAITTALLQQTCFRRFGLYTQDYGGPVGNRVKQIYLHGHRDPTQISPDNWNMDLHFLERPGARKVQLDLLYDYRTNVDLYPQWQGFLRDRQPETLIMWGENDIFFTPEGGRAYLCDLPNAELHMLDSGHFAVENSLDEIATQIKRFYEDRVNATETRSRMDPMASMGGERQG